MCIHICIIMTRASILRYIPTSSCDFFLRLRGIKDSTGFHGIPPWNPLLCTVDVRMQITNNEYLLAMTRVLSARHTSQKGLQVSPCSFLKLVFESRYHSFGMYWLVVYIYIYNIIYIYIYVPIKCNPIESPLTSHWPVINQSLTSH